MGVIQQLLENFARFNLKQCQEIVDAIFGPEYDNSNVPIIMPASIQAHCYGYINAATYLDASWSTPAMNRGDMGIVAEYNVSCYNGVLTFSEPSFIGRDYDTNWTGTYVEPQADECERQLKTVLAGGVYQYYMYPEWAVFPRYTSATNVLMSQKSSGGITSGDWIYSRMKKYNSESYYQVHYVNLSFTPVTITDKGGGYVQASTRGFIPASYAVAATNSAGFITRCNNTTFINRYITDSGSEHNYTYNYTTKNGDAVTVYYGDNYVIFNASDTAKINYNEQKDILDQIANQINIDTGSNIKIPTYDEVKYGPTPPTPSDDDYIDMGLGVETDGMAMYNMAVLTRDDLIQLIGDFETNADTGLSFLPHVLGLYKLGIESSQLLTTKTDTINLHKEPGKTAFISTDNYNIVDEQLQVIDCGTITVDREELLTNTYLDFSPYSTYEMFIPGCGWITLPDTVVGRTISVHIVFDLTTCSCKGVVRSEGELLGGSGSTLATVNGIIGSSVPLSINETGLQRGAIMNGAVQTVTALATTGMGIGIGNPYMGMSGLAMAAGSLAETHIAGNATYTSTKGGATDYSVFGDGYKAVLKITRPKLEIPDNYGHTVGYVVNKYDTLGNYSGFTVCLNPHITGLTCTSDEKEEIARLLESGVILPSGE